MLVEDEDAATAAWLFRSAKYDKCIAELNRQSSSPSREHNLDMTTFVAGSGIEDRLFTAAYAAVVSAEPEASLAPGSATASSATATTQANTIRAGAASTARVSAPPRDVAPPSTPQVLINHALVLLYCGYREGAREVLHRLVAESEGGARLTPMQCLRAGVALCMTTRPSLSGADRAARGSANMLIAAGRQAAEDSNEAAGLRRLVDLSLAEGGAELRQWWLGDGPATAGDAVDATVYFNTLAIDAMAMRTPTIAALFLQRALHVASGLPARLQRDVVCYNAGLCQLARGEAAAACTSLTTAAGGSLASNPLLWLRLGQAHYHRFQALAETKLLALRESEHASISKHLIADATLEDPLFARRSVALPHIPPPNETAAGMALHEAACALEAATRLLLRPNEDYQRAARRFTLHAADDAGPRWVRVLLEILEYATAVALARCCWPIAADRAQQFVQMLHFLPVAPSAPQVARVASFAVEALCNANQLDQALDCLRTIELSSLLPVNESVLTPEVEALLVNTCVVHVISRSWDLAMVLDETILARLSIPAARLLRLYLSVARGNTIEARALADGLK